MGPNPLNKDIEHLRTVRDFWFHKWQTSSPKWKTFCWDNFQYLSGLVRKKAAI